MNNELRREKFLLRDLRVGISRIGQPFSACRLCEPEGTAWPAYWWQKFPYPTIWPDEMEVMATVRPRQLGNRWLFDIVTMNVAALELSPKTHAMPDLPFPKWLLPLTPRPVLLRELWAQICLIRNPWLRLFNQRILHDPDVSLRWVSVPASQRHHHAEPAGLLRHSVEAIRLLSKSPQMSQQEWEIARTALLWHDVGKIMAYRGSSRRLAEEFLTRHEIAIVEVLALHLAWLRQVAPELVTALKLHWYPPQQGRPLMPGRILVEACDRTSAALDSRQQVFSGQPAWRQYGQREGSGPIERFWRLREDSHMA